MIIYSMDMPDEMAVRLLTRGQSTTRDLMHGRGDLTNGFERMNRLLAVLLTLMSSAALAQTTGTLNPSSSPTEPLEKRDIPPGGCMPIGMTAAGELVFPIQCKELLERERGVIEGKKPNVPEERNIPEEKAAAKPPEGLASPENSKPAIKPVATVPPPKRGERDTRLDSSNGCKRYRSYDPASGTFVNYDGVRRPCK